MVVDTVGELVVEVVSAKKGLSACPHCSRSCRRVHDRRQRRIRDLEVSGRLTVLPVDPAAVRDWCDKTAHGNPPPGLWVV